MLTELYQNENKIAERINLTGLILINRKLIKCSEISTDLNNAYGHRLQWSETWTQSYTVYIWINKRICQCRELILVYSDEKIKLY